MPLAYIDLGTGQTYYGLDAPKKAFEGTLPGQTTLPGGPVGGLSGGVASRATQGKDSGLSKRRRTFRLGQLFGRGETILTGLLGQGSSDRQTILGMG